MKPSSRAVARSLRPPRRDRDAAVGRRSLSSRPASRCRPTATRCSRQFDAIFVGALGDPRVPDNRHARDILLGTRFELDLYVNYRPVRLLDERLCPLKDRTPRRRGLRRVPREHRGPLRRRRRPVQGRARDDEVAIQEEINTYKGVHRIIRHAFEYARAHGLHAGLHGRQEQRDDRRARAVAARVHARWRRSIPAFRPRHLYIDALAMLLVQDPVAVRGDRHQQPVRRHHHRHRRARCRAGSAWPPRATSIPGRTSMFEPVHGSAPPLAGKNVANPDGRDPVGGADARDARRTRRGGGHRSGRRSRRSRDAAGDRGHRRHARDDAKRRLRSPSHAEQPNAAMSRADIDVESTA